MKIIKAKQPKFVFIVSHLESGSEHIIDIMNKRKDIYIKTEKTNYKNPMNVLEERKKNKHICGAHLLFNHQFSSKEFYKFCKFIFIIRNGDVIKDMEMLPQNAYKYYSFRLGRILEMAKSAPGSLFLTRENLTSEKGVKLMRDYLEINNLFNKKINFLPARANAEVPLEITETSDLCYSRYIKQFQKLDLLRV